MLAGLLIMLQLQGRAWEAHNKTSPLADTGLAIFLQNENVCTWLSDKSL